MNEIYGIINPYIITIECDCEIRRKKIIVEAKNIFIQKLQKELLECEEKYSQNNLDNIDLIKLYVKILEIRKEIENPHISNYNPINSTSEWECSCIKY